MASRRLPRRSGVHGADGRHRPIFTVAGRNITLRINDLHIGADAGVFFELILPGKRRLMEADSSAL